MALSGVRNSWLMLDKNSDFAEFASSAIRLAISNACSACLRALMSLIMARNSTVSLFPFSLSVPSVIAMLAQNAVRSFLTKRKSNDCGSPLSINFL